MKKVIATTIVVAFIGVMLAFIPAKGVCAETDAEKSSKAIEQAREGDFVKAVSTASTIEDSETKQKTMGKIGDADASKFWSVWGTGLIVNFDTGNNKPIKSASIINGIVRVEEEEDIKYGLGLEVHRFVYGTSWGATKRKPWSGAMALGPYVSVMPGTNDIIDVIGVGIVFGFIGGRTAEADTNKFSMNIAVGGYVDPGTRILADDFEDGKAPPEGETTIRYKTIAQYGVQGMLSFSYNF